MIPVNEPLLDGNERKYLLECLDTGWISSEGPFVERFEAAFAARVGRRHGVAVTSGSAALELGVAALGIGPGDEVILPAFTIISCAAPVVRAGARPVLVDSDPFTWNMDAAQVEARITPRTRAVMAVHLYGLPVDMDPILAAAAKRGVAVIEDAAEMHGQTYRGRACGSFGALSAFSFYPNKHVTTGEGGMVVTDDAALADRLRSMRNLCFRPEARFVHEELGWNYRLTNLQAALGLAQLEKLDRTLARKRAMGAAYRRLLEGLEGVQLPLDRTDYAESVYWVYGLVLDAARGLDAREAMQRLGAAGVGTRPFFWPMHRQPVFEKMGLFAGERYPVAERLGTHGFYLPSGVALQPAQIETVAREVRALLA
ncbi:MAG: aminotransferase DegT [Betaproteobacteria bacterium RIFCSPHIGHO2_12_FULL_69_13]|nr:MAG: aminotransferase DegT [Betaproteobacteria bacterium RIFCSPHIGHO2_12_FULL_69_13]OGA71139.1 MAG: aminotransferase DegT [Betaproteobacteria bacterium RIFCSPLOWO2_12_FULL_68_20]